MDTRYAIVLKVLERFFGKRGSKVIICLVLILHGVSNSEILDKYGIALSTTRKYKKVLDGGNIDSLFVVAERVRERSRLDDFEKEILEDFEKNPPKTLRESQTRIEKLTGIKRSLPRISAWLVKRGFARLQ